MMVKAAELVNAVLAGS